MHQNYLSYHNDDSSFSISHNKVIGHYDMPTHHFHSRYEIYYLISGERYYFIKDRTFHVSEGDLIFIHAHELHKTIDGGTQGHERVLIYFKENYIMTSNQSVKTLLDILTLHDYCIIRLNVDEKKYIENLLHCAMNEIQNQPVGFDIYLQSLIMQLLVFITRQVGSNTSYTLLPPSSKHGKVSEIVQYINQNYMTHLTIPYISKLFFISPYYFSRIFKSTTGFTFVEYLNSIRIREAQKMLLDSELTVTQIAEKVGFGSITHFNRVFKKITGLSPLKYRKTVK